jgi:GH35 family endo-1,4-beta-xylanase
MRNLNMLHFCYLFVLLIASCTPQPPVQPQPIIAESSVNEIAMKDLNPDVLIGSHIDIAYDNAKYMNIAKTEFNSCQALWYGSWGGWLSPGEYDFSRIIRNVNWMHERGVSSQVHMLVGNDLYTPSWIIDGKWTGMELDTLLRDMIYSIMDTNDNKNKVDIWNVANELFEDDGSYRTKMVWNKIGWESDSSDLSGVDKINDKHPLFIRKAFTYCREKTNRKLELRDFNIENNVPSHDNDKRHKAFYQLLNHMLKSNIPIDAVGIQAHLLVGKISWLTDDDALKKAVQKFKALGLEVYITELDARIETQKWTPSVARQQSEDYYNYIKQAIEGGATRINFWGIQDGLDKGWITTEHPLLWDENLNRKPAYTKVRQVLMDTRK